jgi:hypothetical protein
MVMSLNLLFFHSLRFVLCAINSFGTTQIEIFAFFTIYNPLKFQFKRGLGKQGYECHLCGYAAHEDCFSKILTQCSAATKQDTIVKN